MIRECTLSDLWPGDVIIARAPGFLWSEPHRLVDVRETKRGDVIAELSSLDGASCFEVCTHWAAPVERVI